jgi:hypothetical protein
VKEPTRRPPQLPGATGLPTVPPVRSVRRWPAGWPTAAPISPSPTTATATTQKRLAEELSSPRRRAVALQADFADQVTPQRVERLTEERLGGLSMIVAAASAGTARPWKDVDVEL